MSIVFAHKSDVGRIRKQNEDYVWVDGEAGLFIVADGMGGQEAGEMASQLTATTVAKFIMAGIEAYSGELSAAAIQTLMMRALEASNEAVLAAANEEGQTRKMGATIVAVLVRLPVIYICHAGDTRAYLARGTSLTQLTKDDSYVAELLAAGVISEDEAKTHIYQSIVTKAIGQDPPLEPSFTQLNVAPADWLLLCSDGLTHMIGEEDIMAELQKANDSPEAVVETLTNAANEAGGKDNISVIAIRVLADD